MAMAQRVTALKSWNGSSNEEKVIALSMVMNMEEKHKL